MKGDELSDSKTNNRCAIQHSMGKFYTVFIPMPIEQSRNIKANPVVKQLSKNFDYVLAFQAEHCFTPERAELTKCKRGIEATALRRVHKKGSEREDADRDFIFKVADGVGKFDKPIILDVNDNITFYTLECKK